MINRPTAADAAAIRPKAPGRQVLQGPGLLRDQGGEHPPPPGDLRADVRPHLGGPQERRGLDGVAVLLLLPLPWHDVWQQSAALAGVHELFCKQYITS